MLSGIERSGVALLHRVDGCDKVCDLTHFAISLTDTVCDLTHFVSRTKKCRNCHSIVSLRSNIEIHNHNKSFSFMSQSQSVGWVRQNPNNNCQTTSIQLKVLFTFCGPPGIYFLSRSGK